MAKVLLLPLKSMVKACFEFTGSRIGLAEQPAAGVTCTCCMIHCRSVTWSLPSRDAIMHKMVASASRCLLSREIQQYINQRLSKEPNFPPPASLPGCGR